MNHNITLSKREQFRLQIRRKQVQAIFAEKRKLYENEQNFGKIQSQYNDPAISDLIRKSLTKNCLIPELPSLLPSLANKLKNNLSLPNVQFVLSVSSNILRDHIQLEQKQYIYTYCMQALQIVNPCNISPLVEVYFYETVMAACYFYFDQPQQIEIENKIIDRLIQLLQNRKVDMRRIPFNYTQKQCRLEIIEQILSSFVYYYQSESNHNTVLLYKVKRTANKIKQLINWAYYQLNEFQRQQNFVKLLELFNTIINNIVNISYSVCTILGYQSLSSLIGILVNQFYYQSQNLEQVKILATYSLVSLLQDEPKIVFQQFNENIIKIMINELQNCVNMQYLVSILKLFDQIINCFSNGQIKKQNQFDNLLQCLLSVIVNLLGYRQEQTDSKLLMQGLKVIRNILTRGFDEGNSSYVNQLSSVGGQRLLDAIYAATHDKDILQIIDGIYMFFDIC